MQRVHECTNGAQTDYIVKAIHIVAAFDNSPYLQLKLLL